MNVKKAKWLDWATVQQHLLNSFEYFTGAGCYLVPAEQFRPWICLNAAPVHNEVKDIEAHFGKIDWGLFNRRHFEQAVRTRRYVLTARSGHWEYFVPVFRSGRVEAIIVSGFIYRSFPDRQGLERQWKQWTGVRPAPDDPAFMRFVRAVFRQSILEPPVDKAHLELLHLMATAVAREGDSHAVYERSVQILESVLTKHLPHKDWFQSVMSPSGILPAPIWPNGLLSEWERTFTGLTRAPTMGLQAVPLEKAGSEPDPVDRFIRQRRFEREMFLLTRRHLKECYMVPTRDWGAGIVTSTAPGISDFQRRFELKRLAAAISKHFQERMRIEVLIGVGEPVAPGDSPAPSFAQAFLALQAAGHKDSSHVFFGDLGDDDAREPGMNPYRLADTLLELLRKSDSVGIEGTIDLYVRAAWNHSALSIQELKIHYRYLEMAAAHVLGFAFPKALRFLQALLVQGLVEIEREENPEGLSQVFRQWLNRARQSASRTSWGSQSATLETFVRELEYTLREPWTLEEAAKSLGMSRAPFARKFKALMGVGFHEHLLRLRIHTAKKLLREGNLPGVNVALECGFRSGSHFTQAFRREVGKSPIRWRQGIHRAG